MVSNGCIIEKIVIDKFRGFKDVSIEFKHPVTAIVGKNGTMKTTLLGMLAHPFSLKTSVMEAEKPLTGGRSFNSPMSDKFKFSKEYDSPGEHKWSLYINKDIYPASPFTCVSIPRKEKGKDDRIRFWSDEGKGKGTNYIQCPVIYLSLSRLSPIGEEKNLTVSPSKLTDEEIRLYKKLHNQLLIIVGDDIQDVSSIDSNNKHTLGPNTKTYDAWTISAGQDNIGKIILAILSMKRLKENFPDTYKGGIICIDEIESTMYPAAQEKLIDYLYKSAKEYNIQYFFTTHSMSLIKYMRTGYGGNGWKYNDLVCLSKSDAQIKVVMNPTLSEIENDLSVTVSPSNKPKTSNKPKKIGLYSEDDVTIFFAKSFLPPWIKNRVDFIPMSVGTGTYNDLINKNCQEFSKNKIILFDGDVKKGKRYSGVCKRTLQSKNVVCLPSEMSPEGMLYDYFYNLEPSNPFWGGYGEYTKEVCFRDYPNRLEGGDEYKKWFDSQKEYLGRKAHSKLLKEWINKHKEDVERFVTDFVKAYNAVAENTGFETIEDVRH